MEKLLPGEVRRVAVCNLRVGSRAWAYADRNRAEISADFAQLRAATPGYFNGAIQMLVDHSLAGDTFTGHFARTDFASYVHWRAHGFPDATVHDCFGMAILRAADGAILLGVQSAGNLNAGRAYCPGGFIDPADISADGAIDIDGSVMRELFEETGLGAAEVARQPGYLAIATPESIAIGIEVHARSTAIELQARIRSTLAREANPELADVLIVRQAADIDGRPTSPYVPHLLRALLA